MSKILIWQMLHRLIKSRQAINDQMIYLLRSLTGKQVLLCQRKISGEHILIKELYLQVGLHLIIIQKLAIKLFIWHSRAMPRYLPRTNRIINCTNCPCQTVWQIPYFLKSCTWKIATSFKNSEHFAKPL